MGRLSFSFFLSSLVLLCIGTLPFHAYAEDVWHGSVNVVYGKKNLQKKFWSPIEEHDYVGLEVAFGKQSWPALLEVDVIVSEGEATDALGSTVDGRTHSINLGLRKVWETGPVNTFIAGGPSYAMMDYNVQAYGLSGEGLGYWAGAGVFHNFQSGFSLGLQLKYSDVEVRAKQTGTGAYFTGNAGGGHLGLTLGYYW